MSGIVEVRIARPGVAIDAGKVVGETHIGQLHAPVGMRLRLESFRMIQKADGQAKLVAKPTIRISDRRAAFRAERADDASGSRERLRRPFGHANLVRAPADPDGQRAADCAPAIIIMIVADPEPLAVHFGGDGAAETCAGLDSVAHCTTPHRPLSAMTEWASKGTARPASSI
jgi:hypothetical protein